MNREAIEEAIKQYLKELQNYRVDLDADPLASGLSTFNKKVSEAREFTNRSATILTNAIRVRGQVRAARDRAKAVFESTLNSYLANDARVYEVPEGQRSSQELRHANALDLMKEDGIDAEKHLVEMEDFLQVANSFYDISRLTYENLNETRKDLLYQISVIRTQIAIGEVSADPVITRQMFGDEGETPKTTKKSGEVEF